MPIWLVTLLVKAALPIVLKWLQDEGAISGVEAFGVKEGTHILTATKVEDSYPPDHNTGITTGNLPN